MRSSGLEPNCPRFQKILGTLAFVFGVCYYYRLQPLIGERLNGITTERLAGPKVMQQIRQVWDDKLVRGPDVVTGGPIPGGAGWRRY